MSDLAGYFNSIFEALLYASKENKLPFILSGLCFALGASGFAYFAGDAPDRSKSSTDNQFAEESIDMQQKLKRNDMQKYTSELLAIEERRAAGETIDEAKVRALEDKISSVLASK